jgi:hypothetical protein
VSDTMGGALTPDERAELDALRAAKANAAKLANEGPASTAPAATEPTNGYDFEVGNVVHTATGYGLVVERAPMSVVTPEGDTLAGYRVAAFGPCNDMPATAEDLGLEKL